MERNSLESNLVVSGRHRSGNGSGPRGVLVDHLARAPVAVADGAAQQACLVDLEPLEAVGVHARAG